MNLLFFHTGRIAVLGGWSDMTGILIFQDAGWMPLWQLAKHFVRWSKCEFLIKDIQVNGTCICQPFHLVFSAVSALVATSHVSDFIQESNKLTHSFVDNSPKRLQGSKCTITIWLVFTVVLCHCCPECWCFLISSGDWIFRYWQPRFA